MTTPTKKASVDSFAGAYLFERSPITKIGLAGELLAKKYDNVKREL
jgi:hypothetical protein